MIIGFGTLQAQLWQDSYTQALETSKTRELPLVVVFSGSDWCAPCIKMKRRILDSEEFIGAATDNFVFYKADFPKKKENRLPEELAGTNRSLAQKYNPQGHFPLVVVLDREGGVLGKIGYYPRYSPRKYIDILRNFAQ